MSFLSKNVMILWRLLIFVFLMGLRFIMFFSWKMAFFWLISSHTTRLEIYFWRPMNPQKELRHSRFFWGSLVFFVEVLSGFLEFGSLLLIIRSTLRIFDDFCSYWNFCLFFSFLSFSLKEAHRSHQIARVYRCWWDCPMKIPRKNWIWRFLHLFI